MGGAPSANQSPTQTMQRGENDRKALSAVQQKHSDDSTQISGDNTPSTSPISGTNLSGASHDELLSTALGEDKSEEEKSEDDEEDDGVDNIEESDNDEMEDEGEASE